MTDPRPIKLTQVDEQSFAGAYEPREYQVVGPIPVPESPVADFVEIPVEPADADELAEAVIALRDALVTAGLMAADD